MFEARLLSVVAAGTGGQGGGPLCCTGGALPAIDRCLPLPDSAWRRRSVMCFDNGFEIFLIVYLSVLLVVSIHPPPKPPMYIPFCISTYCVFWHCHWSSKGGVDGGGSCIRGGDGCAAGCSGGGTGGGGGWPGPLRLPWHVKEAGGAFGAKVVTIGCGGPSCSPGHCPLADTR